MFSTFSAVSKWNYLIEKNLTKDELKEELKEEISELKSNLTINAKNTSAAIRRRTSARDDRTSAFSVGYVGISILVIPLVLMVCFDGSNCFASIKASKQMSRKSAIVDPVKTVKEVKPSTSRSQNNRQ